MKIENTYDSITNLETDSIHESSGGSPYVLESQNSFVCEFLDGTFKKYVAPNYNLDLLVKVKRNGMEVECFNTLTTTSEGYKIYQEPPAFKKVKELNPLNDIDV